MKNKKICILDYGSGNTGSLANLLNRLNFDVNVSNTKNDIEESSHIILPGVGAFGASIEKIREKIPLDILEQVVHEKQRPFLGICVGMQVLANKSSEFGEHKGLGWINGTVEKLKAKKLPHVGWNTINILKKSPIFNNLKNLKDFYFVNSYVFKVEDKDCIIAKTEYEEEFCSAVQKNNIFGVQFHPEKSHSFGEQLIKNFLEIDN
jgi:imidazole glycerol-phosphate synthase subunit HisH